LRVRCNAKRDLQPFRLQVLIYLLKKGGTFSIGFFNYHLMLNRLQ
jgi:hypothetical protein